jgi:trehalose-phosphatase
MANDHTRVVLVSGRWTKSLLPMLGLRRTPEVWGSHGWEQLKPSGDYAVGHVQSTTMRDLLDAEVWISKVEAAGGRCERKPGGLAIHWRGLAANQVADIRAVVFEQWKEQALHKTLLWHDFDGGIELRAPGRTKGFVVDTVLAELAGDAAVAYVGDDLTDEDAFRALRGRGIGVLVRPELRPTAADLWLRPPQELLEFLDRWYAAGEGSRRGCA